MELDASSKTSGLYDTELEDRSDPVLKFEIDRQATGALDLTYPNANSDHLWQFSQADLYCIQTMKFGSTTYYHRHLVGWTSDESLVALLLDTGSIQD